MATLAKPKFVAKTKDIVKAVASPLKKIDAKQAVTNAVGYFQEFFPQHAKTNMLLEEIEESGDGKRWLVTLGYDTPNREPRQILFGVSGSDLTRAYKVFSVDSVTGKVVSVKIRKV
jgi:hypothetical protein